MSEAAFNVLMALAPIIVACAFILPGRVIRRLHMSRLAAGEVVLFRRLKVLNTKRLPHDGAAEDVRLVIGSVVLSLDRFGYFVAALKKLVGGRVRMVEDLLLRGRREALLRAARQAADFGARYLLNVRFETSLVFRTTGGGKGIPQAEVLCYATAVRVGER